MRKIFLFLILFSAVTMLLHNHTEAQARYWNNYYSNIHSDTTTVSLAGIYDFVSIAVFNPSETDTVTFNIFSVQMDSVITPMLMLEYSTADTLNSTLWNCSDTLYSYPNTWRTFQILDRAAERFQFSESDTLNYYIKAAR